MKYHLLTTFGLGHLRPASGTWGSLPPVVVFLLLVLVGAPAWVTGAVLVATFLFFSWVCVAFGDWAEARWKKDPSQVVADETAGQTLALLPLLVVPMSPWAGAACAFFAFRAFDILKLPPASNAQHLPSGWGILVDDWIAGIEGAVVVVVVAMLAAGGA